MFHPLITTNERMRRRRNALSYSRSVLPEWKMYQNQRRRLATSCDQSLILILLHFLTGEYYWLKLSAMDVIKMLLMKVYWTMEFQINSWKSDNRIPNSATATVSTRLSQASSVQRLQVDTAATTIRWHHLDGCVTGSITPMRTSRSMSAFTFSCQWSGTVLGTDT